MTNRTTREQAEAALEALLIEHSSQAYFQRGEVVPADSGYGIDVWVEREGWEQAKWGNNGVPVIGSRYEDIPVCVMVVG